MGALARLAFGAGLGFIWRSASGRHTSSPRRVRASSPGAQTCCTRPASRAPGGLNCSVPKCYARCLSVWSCRRPHRRRRWRWWPRSPGSWVSGTPWCRARCAAARSRLRAVAGGRRQPRLHGRRYVAAAGGTVGARPARPGGVAARRRPDALRTRDAAGLGGQRAPEHRSQVMPRARYGSARGVSGGGARLLDICDADQARRCRSPNTYSCQPCQSKARVVVMCGRTWCAGYRIRTWR